MKKVRKSLSLRKHHSFLYPNERDGISAILLWTPGMWRGVIGQASFALMRYASARSSSAAGRDRLDAIRSTHETDGLLSLNRRVCLCRRSSTTCSITSQSRINPAISKSEFVIDPSGLSSVWRSAFTSSGHSSLNTVGLHLKVMPNTIPPTPSFDASTMPATSGSPGASCLTRVLDVRAPAGRLLSNPSVLLSIHCPFETTQDLAFGPAHG